MVNTEIRLIMFFAAQNGEALYLNISSGEGNGNPVKWSSILTWKIPRAEQPGRLQSMGSQRAGHDRVTNSPNISSGISL